MQTQAIIFDVDGVLVNSPHERAWGDTLRRLMEGEWAEIQAFTDYAPERYTTAVYQSVVAGKPRADGARDLLLHFGIPDEDARVARLCEQKQAMIVDLIARGEFEAFHDAVEFLLRALASGLKVAAASSSKNANAMMQRLPVQPFLEHAGIHMETIPPDACLLDVLDANVSGRDIQPGKPHPLLFLTAAEEIPADPSACIVVEDAPSGVEAAKAGGMRALGVARHGDEDLLRAAGADWVLTSLEGLDPASLDP